MCSDQSLRDNPYTVSYFAELFASFCKDPLSIKLLMQRTNMLQRVIESVSDDDRCAIGFTEYTNVFHIEIGHGEVDLVMIIANYSMQYPLLCYFLLDPQSGRGVVSVSKEVLCHSDHRLLIPKIFQKYLNPLVNAGLLTSECLPSSINQDYPTTIYWDTSVIPHLGHYVMNDLSFAVRLYQTMLLASSSCILARVANGYIDQEDEQELIGLYAHNYKQIQYFQSRSELLNTARSRRAALISIFDATVTQFLAESLKYYFLAKGHDYCGRGHAEYVNSEFSLPTFDLVIGVGLRGGTRQALNLGELLQSLQECLLMRNLKVCYIFDGLADSLNNSVSTTKDLSVDLEASIADELSAALLQLNASCVSVVGLPLIRQLSILKDCDLFIAHQGSSSVKYSYLLSKPVVLHGPIRLGPTRKRVSTRPVGIDFLTAYRAAPAPYEMLLSPECIDVDGTRLDRSSLSRQELFRMNYSINLEFATQFILSVIDSLFCDNYPICTLSGAVTQPHSIQPLSADQ